MTSVGRDSVASRSNSGAERAIDERHLAVVRLRGVGGARCGSGGRYGECGSKTCTHAKNRAGCLADPARPRVRRPRRRAAPASRSAIAPRAPASVVVDVEARRQPEALRQRKPADERAGRKARRLQPRRQRRGAGLDAEAAVVAHAVLVRQQAAEDASCATGSVTTACACANVNRAPPAARRSRFGVCAPPAVRRQRVGPQRVDRDEQDVLVGVRFEHERAAARPPDGDRSKRDDSCGPNNPAGQQPTTAGIRRCKTRVVPGFLLTHRSSVARRQRSTAAHPGVVRLPWSLSPPRTQRTRSNQTAILGVLGVLCGERLLAANSAHLSGSDIVSIVPRECQHALLPA